MAEIRRPPVLGVGHQRSEVFLQCLVVELLEFLGIVEVCTERVLSGVVLAQDVGPELIGPPVDILGAAASNIGSLYGTLAFRHDEMLSSCVGREDVGKTAAMASS